MSVQAWKQENRIRELEEQVTRMEEALFLAGLDFCEYCRQWQTDADMVNGLGNYFEGCCKNCVTIAYDKDGPEVDNLEGLNDALAFQFYRRESLRKLHPKLWESLAPLIKTPEFNRKHKLM